MKTWRSCQNLLQIKNWFRKFTSEKSLALVLLNILVSSLSVKVHCGQTGQKLLISFKNFLLIISIFFFISVWEVLEGGEEVAPGRVRAGALFNENQSHREDSHCSTTLWCTSNEQKDRIFSAARCRCSNEKKAMQCITPMAGCAVVHFYSGAVRGNPLLHQRLPLVQEKQDLVHWANS